MLKVERYIAGHFTAAAGIWRRGDDMERKLRYPVPVYLVETDTERVLIDTGLHPGLVADPSGHYGAAEAMALFELDLEASVAEQVELTSLTKVVITHLHFDHASALDLLPGSVPVFVQRREWAAAQDEELARRNFFFARDFAEVADQVVVVDGEHDLLGDGSVVLLPTPGHTPGHQSVRIGESLVVGGDVMHFASGLDDHRFPIFAHDFEAQAHSADRLRAMRDAGMTVTPGHDPRHVKPSRPCTMTDGYPL